MLLRTVVSTLPAMSLLLGSAATSATLGPCSTRRGISAGLLPAARMGAPLAGAPTRTERGRGGCFTFEYCQSARSRVLTVTPAFLAKDRHASVYAHQNANVYDVGGEAHPRLQSARKSMMG